MQPVKVSRIEKAVIAVPPVQDFYFTPHRFSSLGAQIVSNLLNQKGIKTTLFQFPLLRKKPLSIPLPPELSYLRAHLLPGESGKLSFFSKYKQYGPPFEQCAEAITSETPDLCFVSCFAFCYAPAAIKLAEQVKKRNPSIVVIAGGAGVSAFPEYFLNTFCIDYTISGEAEVSVGPFIHYLMEPGSKPDEIPGLGWKSAQGMHFSQSREFAGGNQIQPCFSRTGGSFSFSISLSRGCPLRCNFCSNHLSHGDTFRHCNDENFRKAAIELNGELSSSDPVCINFEDDNLLLDYDFWIRCLKELKSQFPQVRFFAENGIDYRLLTPSRCNELIELGFSQFNLSLGSADTGILRGSNRAADLQLYDNILSIAATADIPVVTYFICGLKQETRQSIAENLSFLSHRPTLAGISLFYAVPGIPGFEHRAQFKKASPVLCAGSSAFPWNGSIGTETLITAFRLARFVNLLKSATKSDTDTLLISKILESGRLHTSTRTKTGAIEISEVPGHDSELVRAFLKLYKKGR